MAKPRPHKPLKVPHLFEQDGRYRYRFDYPAKLRTYFGKATRFGTLEASPQDLATAIKELAPIVTAHKRELARVRALPAEALLRERLPDADYGQTVAIIADLVSKLSPDVRRVIAPPTLVDAPPRYVPVQHANSRGQTDDAMVHDPANRTSVAAETFLDDVATLAVMRHSATLRPPPPDLDSLPPKEAFSGFMQARRDAAIDKRAAALSDRLTPALSAIGLGDPPQTLSHHVQRWISSGAKRTRQPNTIRRLNSQTGLLLKHIGDRQVGSITKTDLLAYLDSLDTATIAAGTFNNHVATIKALFGWMKRRDIISADPSVDLERREDARGKSEKRRRFTRAELAKIVSAAEKEWGTTSEAYILLMISIYAGTRLSEAPGLMRADLMQTEDCPGEWFFRLQHNPHRRLKTTESERMVPVHPDILQAVLSHADTVPSGGLLFPKHDTARRVTRLSEQFSGLIRTIPEFVADSNTVWHSLRHGWEACAVSAEMPDRVRQALIGEKPRGRQGLYDSAPGLLQMVKWMSRISPLTG
jgi:site-specific recombinase XerD